MIKTICPFCGEDGYEDHPSNTFDLPSEGWCNLCGFHFSTEFGHDRKTQAKAYGEWLEELNDREG